MKSILLPIFIFFVALASQTVYGFHCTNVLQKEGDGVLNFLGNVTFAAPKAVSGQWNLVMKTDIPFTFIGGWQVWVQSDADSGIATFKSRRTDLEIAKGERVSMRFRIQWGRKVKQPQVISLIWNDIQLCE